MSLMDLIVRIGADITDFQKKMQEAEKTLSGASDTLKKVGSGVTNTGKSFTTGITVPVLGLSAAIIKTAGDFESEMNRVQALTDATAEEFSMLRQEAIDLGGDTIYSASEVADAMGFLAMAGFDVNEIYGAIPSTLQLAAAAQIDIGRAADITSNILTGYGLTVEDLAHANDVLVKAMTSTNVDLGMIGESFKYVAPIAKNAGWEFEEVVAAIGLLGNAGIQGSMAGTVLRGALSALLDPTKEVKDKLAELGINVYNTDGSLKSLTDIIREFENAGVDASDMMAIFGDRAGPGMTALVDQTSDAVGNLTDELEDSGGTAQRIAETQMKGLNGQIEELKGALETLALKIADTGLLEDATNFAEKMSDLIDRIGDLDPNLLKLGVTVAMVAAAVGPLLIGVGMMISGAGSLIGVLSGASAALSGLSGVSLGLLGPIGLLIAIIVGVAAVLIYLWTTSEDFRNGVITIFNSLLTAAGSIFDELSKTVSVYMEVIWQVVTVVLDWINQFWSQWGDAIMALVKGNWDMLVLVFSTAISVLGDIISIFLALMRGDFGAAFDHVKNIASTLWNALGSIFQIGKNTLNGVIAGLCNGMESSFRNMKNTIIDILNGLIDKWNSISIDTPFGHIGGGAQRLEKDYGGTSQTGANNTPSGTNKGYSGPGRAFDAFADGGYVTKPTFALIGEAGPEYVIPERKMGSVGGQQIIVQVNIDGQQLTDLLGERMVRTRVTRRGSASY